MPPYFGKGILLLCLFSFIRAIPQLVSFQSTIQDIGTHSSPWMFMQTLTVIWEQIGKVQPILHEIIRLLQLTSLFISEMTQ